MSQMHRTSLLSTPGQFGPVLLPQVSKNDDEEHCFLKYFGFSSTSINGTHETSTKTKMFKTVQSFPVMAISCCYLHLFVVHSG